MSPIRLPVVRMTSEKRQRAALVGAAVLVGFAAPLGASGQPHFACEVVDRGPLERLGREGHGIQQSHYKCRITGGLLDGFVATGTNVWELDGSDGKLLGSIGIAQKGGATVVYQVAEGAVHRISKGAQQPAGWESTTSAIIRLATGSAAPLTGKSFKLRGRLVGDRLFTMDATFVD